MGQIVGCPPLLARYTDMINPCTEHFHIDFLGKFASNVSEKLQGLMFSTFAMILYLVGNIRLKLRERLTKSQLNNMMEMNFPKRAKKNHKDSALHKV